jgi:hypothetical protein
VKVTAVTPSAAASNPSHPDHARWVKEQTLKLEANHANATGMSFRVAESNNTRQLERLANRKRRPPKKKKAAPTPTAEQLAKQGVTARPAPARKAPPMPPCKLCRVCVWCKRAIRVSHIGLRARQDDLRARALQDELNAIMIAAITRKDYRDALARELPFSRIVGHDVDKAVTMGIEWVCDRSVNFMGQWR